MTRYRIHLDRPSAQLQDGDLFIVPETGNTYNVIKAKRIRSINDVSLIVGKTGTQRTVQILRSTIPDHLTIYRPRMGF